MDCPRGRKDCLSLSQIVSDGDESFFCCGENNMPNKVIEGDIYTVCFKGEFRDDMTFNDKRDLTHNAAVLINALATIEKDYTVEKDWSPWD